MNKNPTSVLERLGKFLNGQGRAANLQEHHEWSHRFAVIAPLGAGAMIAMHTLHQAEQDELASAGARHRRGRSRAAMGLLGAALAVSLSLPAAMPLQGAIETPLNASSPNNSYGKDAPPLFASS
jgi:hypothetical protein